MSNAVTLRRERNVFILTMNDGENRFNPQFVRDLNKALDEVEKCADNVALVSTSSTKYYSNGLDLKWMSQHSEQEVNGLAVGFLSLIRRFLTLSVPTVAAINGHVYAGGFMMGMAHDYRIMNQEKGWLCLPLLRNRYPLHPGLRHMLTNKIGNKGALRDLVLFGTKFTGSEAHALRVVDRVTPEASVVATAVALAQQLADAKPDRAQLISLKQELYREAVDNLDKKEAAALLHTSTEVKPMHKAMADSSTTKPDSRIKQSKL